jgi:hypothetical protein
MFKRHDYELNLKINFSTFDEELDCEAFAKMLEWGMDAWQDGRRPFDVEMFRNGLYECMKKAAYEVLCQQTQKEFGTEVIVSEDGLSEMARWAIEAEEREQVVPEFSDSFKVEIHNE